MTTTEKLKIETASLGHVESAAFNSGEARSKLLASVFAAAGAKPKLALYEKVRLAVVVGFMASALARKGDNRTEQVLRVHSRDRILNYQGAGGKGKLRQGQKGRRNQIEEDAYASARVLVSRVMNDAGVKVPTKSGSNSNTKASVAAKKGATGKQTKAKETPSKPAVHTFKSAEKLIEYALIQAKALQSTWNKSASHGPERLGTAINHFLSEVIEASKEAGMAS